MRLTSGMKLHSGTIADVTLIAASGSTTNEQKARDPEMRQTKKNANWHFGMKLHFRIDTRSGLAHGAVATAGNVHASLQCCCMGRSGASTETTPTRARRH
ncbi:hypothetical protein C5O80_31630 [Burkholderia sp. SRS-46]|nr:hypothetical protein C5O80_31630 [Burkholderia sp. SRS-46]